jgi:hypothetical protein
MHGVINDDNQLYDFTDDETRHVEESYSGGYYQDIDTADRNIIIAVIVIIVGTIIIITSNKKVSWLK